MRNILNSHRLAKELEAEGLIPPGCSDVKLLIPASGVMVLHFERFVEVKELGQLARAMTRAAEAEQAAEATEGNSWRPAAREG